MSTEQPPSADDKPAEGQKGASLTDAAVSAAAALFGVQSQKNRERDFASASPGRFIFMGAVMTCTFIFCVLLAVRCSMMKAGVAAP